MKYDIFISGRWRNRDLINQVAQELRSAGKSVYNFLENPYEGDGIAFEAGGDPESQMTKFESIKDWQTNQTLQKMFVDDMHALKSSDALVLVFPAGFSAHMELGVAYGLGKKCYAIGQPEKVESLYLMLDGVFDTAKDMLEKTT